MQHQNLLGFQTGEGMLVQNCKTKAINPLMNENVTVMHYPII